MDNLRLRSGGVSLRLSSFFGDGKTTSVTGVVPRSKALSNLEAEDETANTLCVAVAEFKSRHSTTQLRV
jgi:hypothetical protein